LHRDCDYNSTISVLVGNGKQLFTVHKDLICDSSKFFKAACSANWVEGRKGKVKLPAVMPRDFQRYLAWLYSKKLQAASKEAQVAVMHATIDLYILGDVLDDIRLRNAAIELLFMLEPSSEHGLPSIDTVEKMWTQTPPNSFLRNMYVEKYVFRLEAEYFRTWIAVAALRYRSDNQGFKSKLESFLELVPEND
jgi:hypothetical protein